MTAPTNTLAKGGYPVVEPGGSFTARFSITIDADPPVTPT